MKNKIVAVTSGKYTPSARFRIRQHINNLNELGLDVTESIPSFEIGNPKIILPDGKRVRNYPKCWPELLGYTIKSIVSRRDVIEECKNSDLIWLERGLIPGLLTYERLLKKPIVYDVDDAVWLIWPGGQKQVSYISTKSDVIIAGNSYIANRLSAYNKNIEIVPTAVNGKLFFPRPKKDEFFRIGWTGTSGNFKYLYKIENALFSVLDMFENVRLKIVADIPPKFKILPIEKIEFVKWSKEIEATEINTFTVGIMPLDDDEWTKGKCAFKIIQYMASGIPCVASPVGSNLELLNYHGYGLYAKNDSEWKDCIIDLYRSSSSLNARVLIARNTFEENYSSDVISAQLFKIFKGV